MPKGEHFKKSNPRNTQVSFKVSEKEHEKLLALANRTGMSIPQWIRLQIEKGRMQDDTQLPNKSKKGESQMSLF